MPSNGSSSGAAVWAILRKECRSEWRTRYGLNAALLFAITTLTSVSFAVGRLSDRTDLLSALLWVVLLFAALASLAHAFVRDSFQNLHSVYEELARLDGAARGALQQSIGMSQLGELVEGVQKTLCMSVDGDPPDHAFVVGQTEDRRVSVKQVYPAGSVAA